MFPLSAAIPWRLLGVLALAAGAFWAGYQWHAGRVAQDQLTAQEHAADLQRIQRRAMDVGAQRHAQRVRTLNTQLGVAHARIAQLSGRDCLDPGTVGLLNNIGSDPVRAATGQPPGEAPATAADRGNGNAGGGLRYTTNRDAATAIAICRARYEEVSSQLNEILDIEDARHGPIGAQ